MTATEGLRRFSFAKQGELVVLRNGHVFPDHIEVTVWSTAIPPADPPVVLTLEIDDEDKPIVTMLVVMPVHKEGLSATQVRDLGLGDLFAEAIDQVAQWAFLQHRLGDILASTPASASGPIGSRGKPGPFRRHVSYNEGLEVIEEMKISGQLARRRQRGPSADDLRRVVEVYRASSGQPTVAVAEQLNLSKRTATRWVAIAREQGLLAPYREDKPSGQ